MNNRQIFDSLNYDNTATVTHGAWIFTARIEPDDGMRAPWKEHDGHGPVSEWTTRDKTPGELVLCSDYGSKRYYDYATACHIARRDGWGPPLYRADTEHGANALVRINAQWFIGCDMHSHTSDWCDDIAVAYTQCRDAMRASYPSARAYHAAAAMADYDRLRRWCEGYWYWCGVIVTVTHAQTGDDLGNASLWGIESDSGDGYMLDTVNELAAEVIVEARETAQATNRRLASQWMLARMLGRESVT